MTRQKGRHRRRRSSWSRGGSGAPGYGQYTLVKRTVWISGAESLRGRHSDEGRHDQAEDVVREDSPRCIGDETALIELVEDIRRRLGRKRPQPDWPRGGSRHREQKTLPECEHDASFWVIDRAVTRLRPEMASTLEAGTTDRWTFCFRVSAVALGWLVAIAWTESSALTPSASADHGSCTLNQ